MSLKIPPLRTAIIALAALLACAAAPAGAQDFPTKPVKIIVPFPPGATVDTVPRLVGEKLSQRWGQPVVIENRAGAAGNIGADFVAHSDPDGHTILVSPPPPIAINQSLYAKMSFDPNAFVPVTVMAEIANVLVLRKGLAPNLKELIAFAKANPDKLSYGSAGNGSTPHITMEWLKLLSGMKIVHVPYRGSAPALTDLLGGQIDMMFDNLGNTLQYIQEGKLSAVVVGSAKRLKALPDVPTLSELYGDAVSVTWFGVVAPPGTPKPIAQKLYEAISDALKLPDIQARLESLNAEAGSGTPDQTADMIQRERVRWKKVIADTGVKLD
jgi:tripartite-type tricarboxylate transporter receptor subunit TctC